MNKRSILGVVVLFLFFLAASLMLLNLLDSIAHEELYSRGSVFSETWVGPFTLIVTSTILIMIVVYRKRKTQSPSRLVDLETKEPPKHKIYYHTLYFRSLPDAEAFEDYLKEQLPSLRTEASTTGHKTVLSFSLHESIENLDSFPEIDSFKIIEKGGEIIG